MGITEEEQAGIYSPLLANDILAAVETADITADELADTIGEVSVQTQTSGPPILTMSLIDPSWKIQRSAICAVDEDGFLVNQIDVNYPPGGPVWWRMVMAEGGGDLTSANLTLTFRFRLVDYLSSCTGPFSAPPGTKTRAEFVKAMFDRMKHEIDKSVLGPGGLDDIHFICPEIDVIQPIAPSDPSRTSTPDVSTAAISDSGNVTFSKSASVNKTAGAGAGAEKKLTVRGRQISSAQRHRANIALGVGNTLRAPHEAMVACIYAAMGETDLGDDPNTFNGSGTGGAVGVWQGTPGTWGDGKDVTGQATAFYKGGRDFQAGGAIARALAGDPAWKIANEVEANAVWIHSRGDSYAGYFPGGQRAGIAEAKAIVAGGGAATVSSSTPTSDVSQLARGTSDNPDEDSWSCMQRLASEVNWDLFASPQPHPGHWGNYLYYISGTKLAAQKPSLYIQLSADGTEWTATTDGVDGNTPTSSDGAVSSLSYTFDNTAFQYEQAVSGSRTSSKKAKKTRIRTPQTPAQCRFAMVSAPMEFNAGDVFVFQDAGPINGRWVVEDVTHNTISDLFAQFTLGPPTVAYPEPQGEPITDALGADGLPAKSGVTAHGSAAGAAQAAEAALRLQQENSNFTYAEVRPINYNILKNNPISIDCSGFVTACYKVAGLHDPNGLGYNGAGYTGSLIAHCTKISEGDAGPGDLCFFGSSESSTTHVNIYVGNGQSISMGSQGEPKKGPSSQMGPSGFLGFYRSNYATPSRADDPTPASVPAGNPVPRRGSRPNVFTTPIVPPFFDGRLH